MPWLTDLQKQQLEIQTVNLDFIQRCEFSCLLTVRSLNIPGPTKPVIFSTVFLFCKSVSSGTAEGRRENGLEFMTDIRKRENYLLNQVQQGYL